MTRCGVAGSNSLELALGQAADVARELDAGGLHAEADAEVGNLLFAGVADAFSMPSMPRLPKPPGTRMPSKPQAALARFVLSRFEAFGFDPV
jgi:hypothetical protein